MLHETDACEQQRSRTRDDRWTKTPQKIADGKPRWELAARYSIRLPKIASPAWIKIYIASCLAPSNKFYYRATKSNFGKTFIFHLCLQPRNSKQSKSGKILKILFEALNN